MIDHTLALPMVVLNYIALLYILSFYLKFTTRGPGNFYCHRTTLVIYMIFRLNCMFFKFCLLSKWIANRLQRDYWDRFLMVMEESMQLTLHVNICWGSLPRMKISLQRSRGSWLQPFCKLTMLLQKLALLMLPWILGQLHWQPLFLGG